MLLFLETKGVAYVGIGGGSDSVQAAILSLLEGKPACVISIRANKTSSQSSSGKMHEERLVTNHGGEVMQGVFRITPETNGSGRFLENLLADKVPTYLVIDYQDQEQLSSQIQAVFADMAEQYGIQVDTIIGVDTGGDALYRSTVADKSKATPDQDLRSLRHLVTFTQLRRFSAIIAKGVDTPPYADDVLKQAVARYVALNGVQTQFVLNTYREIELDGSNPSRYGKTPFAWQAALRGQLGEITLPLPEQVVNHPTNPWNPIVSIAADTAGIYIMDMEQHLISVNAN